MKPADLSVYDDYAAWFTHLLTVCSAINGLPLDEMLAANARMQLVGAYVGPDQTEQVDPVSAARQRRLIEQAIAFRDGVRPNVEGTEHL